MIQGTTKICKNCKSINRPGANFCISCGLTFKERDWKTARNNLDINSVKASLGGNQEEINTGQDTDERFQIRSVIFNDDDGSVFEAWDSQNNTEVIFKGDTESDLDESMLSVFRTNFTVSGRRLQAVSHPRLPEIRDYFFLNNQYCVVMDYIRGKSLHQIIKKSKERTLKTIFVVKCVLAVSEILESLQSLNPPIYHLNIKPTKIIISYEGKVNLLPWLIRPGVHGELIGTRGYASPEQYCGQFDCRSDVYGLGALLHAMLTGRDPQKEAPFHFLPLSILRPDLPGEFETIVRTALSLKREDRYQTIRKFSSALISAAGKYLKQR
jgi:eukaryotic-like serine/threonine-protein kinase